MPTQALELVEAAAARDAALERRIEPRVALQAPLDVLVQHLVTCALGGGFPPADLLQAKRQRRQCAAQIAQRRGFCRRRFQEILHETFVAYVEG